MTLDRNDQMSRGSNIFRTSNNDDETGHLICSTGDVLIDRCNRLHNSIYAISLLN